MHFQKSNSKVFRKNRLLILILSISLMFLILHLFSGYIITYTRNAFTPIFSQSAEVLNNVTDLKSYFKNIDYYKKENFLLKTEISRLESSLAEVSGYAQRIYRLEALLDLKTQSDSVGKPTVCSTIVSAGGTSFIINKGSDAGISPHDAVVSHYGIVGRVGEVSNNYSVVQTVQNKEFTVFARNIRSGDLCTLKGNSKTLILMNSHMVVREGDIFETSGGDDGFCSGMSIGKSTNVFEKDGVLCFEITPFANVSELKEVLVIIDE